MNIKRQEFINELKLREQIRKIIKVAKFKKAQKGDLILQEEQKLRAHIRYIIKEIATEEAPGAKGRATGIRVLDEEVLQNIIPIFKKYYMQLDTPEKRESFRSHIINAAENLLSTIGIDQEGGTGSALQAEPEPIAEQDVSLTVKDNPMFIPVEEEAADPEETAQAEFRTGLEDELTPDQEVGALRAQTAFNGPDTTIKKAYKDLRGQDATLFGEYLITNLKLHFDAMEEEISMTPEPTTPSYEETTSEMPTGPEGAAMGPEGAPLPPEEEVGGAAMPPPELAI